MATTVATRTIKKNFSLELPVAQYIESLDSGTRSRFINEAAKAKIQQETMHHMAEGFKQPVEDEEVWETLSDETWS